MPSIEIEARLEGYDKRWVWYRIPKPGAASHVILTMPRDFMPHGYATSEKVVLEYEEDSFRHTDNGFVVDGRIVRKVDE